MLAFDPKQRATMASSLADPCFDDYREDDLEARAGYRVEMDDVSSAARFGMNRIDAAAPDVDRPWSRGRRLGRRVQGGAGRRGRR